MKTAAAVIDRWKLPIFKRHLDKAGYAYTESLGISRDTITLVVKYEFVKDLKLIIDAANAECAAMRRTD